MWMTIPLNGAAVVFDACTHDPSTGAISDADSAPTFDVFENTTDAEILSGQTMTKRTSKTGDYRGSFSPSTGNGFEVDKYYNVVVTGIVGGVTAKKKEVTFRIVPAESQAGVPKVDLAYWLGTAPLALASQFVRVSVGVLDDSLLTAAKFASGAFDAVWSVSTRSLTTFGTLVSDIWSAVTRTITDKTGFALTSGERTSIANEVEAQIIDDTDSEKVLQAITDKIAAVNPSLSGLTLGAIAAAVRDVLNTSPASNSLGAMVKAAADRMPGSGTLATTSDVPTAAANRAEMDSNSTRLAAINAKTTNLPSDPADESQIEAAISAAASTLAAAIAALNNLSQAQVLTQVNAGLDATLADSIPAVGSRPSLRQAAYMGTQFLVERSVSGTTMTIKKPGGATLFTITLNDATTPTALQRAS